MIRVVCGNMVEYNLPAFVFQTFLVLCLAYLSSASCEKDSLGVENNVVIPDRWLTSSSTLNANTPARNGRLNYTAGQSWCASSSNNNPYLEIDLQILHIICAVSTQGNHQANDWVKTFSLQWSKDGKNWRNYIEDDQSSKKIFSGNYDRNTIVKHILYVGIVARYVRFVVGIKQGEACMRAEVFGAPRHDIKGNMALHKPTDQFGLFESAFSSYAVDGSDQNNYEKCAHTSSGKDAWWRVDLGRVEDVAEVHILSRDSFPEHMYGAEIRVGDSTVDGGEDNYVCANNIRLAANKEGTFSCKPTASARYVYIRNPGNNKVVTLCEVKVYSFPNLAVNQQATQVSVDHGGEASRAVDGDKHQEWSSRTCIHTNYANDPWWRVDLNASHPVAEVVIVNRFCYQGQECATFMNAFEIRIGNDTSTNTSCGGTLSMANGETKSFYCDPPIVGRYVSVVIPGTRKLLSICEVEVYSIQEIPSGVTACRMNSVGVSDSSVIYDQRFSASSSLSSSHASNGRLNGGSAWIPSSNNNNNDYLQIDLGSVYVVCAVASQGNPSANDWTKTYKIETSLDNVNWQWYQENNAVKIFTGNSQRQEIVKNDLYNPLAVKFIRFYPLTNHVQGNKALRVEVYGSKQGCLSPVGNEEGVLSRPFSVTASSSLDVSHRPVNSALYGSSSWCSSLSASSRKYLQFDFGKVVTVSGIATQGDAVDDKWVKKYAVSYGYDGQSWLDYDGGQPLTGNSDKSSVVVRWFSLPFAAQFVRILPKSYNTAQCMRVDLFGCRDFQVAFLYVNVSIVTLPATHGASVSLNCITKSSKQRPHALVYEWRKDGFQLAHESSSSLTITYSNASDTNNKYHCISLSSSSRVVQCTAVYQCSVQGVGLPEVKKRGNSTVTVLLKKPGQVIGVSKSKMTARTALVTWASYFPGKDEAPTSITVRYQNSTSPYNLMGLSVSSSRKELTNLKPFSKYSVTVMASSALGDGLWSDAVNFTTLTASPEITIQVDNTTGVTSQSIYVEWKKSNIEKLNGPFVQYTIAYRESEGAEMLANVTNIDKTFHTIPNLKKWTLYFIKVRVENRDHAGPWSSNKDAKTQQDAPSAPQNLQLTFIKPSQNTRPQMNVTWSSPVEENGVITKYTLTYRHNFGGVTNSTEVSTNSQTFEYNFDVLGGVKYTVSVYAETIKPGPKEEQVESVPVYKPSTAPFEIASQSYNETTYRISWDPLTREKSNGEVLAYEVKDIKVYHAGSPSLSAPRNENTTNTMVTLQELVACSTYHVLVRAYTSAGAGPFSPSLEIVTNAPGPPRDVRAGTPGKRNITLTWKRPLRYGDDVQMYTVFFEGTKSYYPEFKHINSVQTVALSREITDLYPDTKYNFVVIATTHCGDGDNSTMVTIRMVIDAPPAPKNRGGPQKIERAGSSVNLTIWAATQDNGPISYYQILVHQVQDWTDTVSDWNDFGSNFYISAQIRASVVKTKMIFLLGDGENKGPYKNKELSRGQKYKIYSRALTKKSSKKRSTDERFLIGQAQLLAQVQVEAVETGGGNQKEEESSSTAGVVGTVVPVVVVVLLIVGAVAGVIFWRRRRGSTDRSSKGSESHPMTDVSVNSAYDTIRPDSEDSQPQTTMRAERGEPVGATGEPIYGNAEVMETEDKPKPIPVSQFSEYVTQMRRDKNAGFAKQYKLLSSGQQFPWEHAKKPGNKNKNRYANIIAYDHSRVILPLIDGDENSDYVNASYLHGYDSTPNTYIACQGPVPGTYQDFWRMLWQENVTTVVMLTRLVEHGRTKCHQYWPEKAETYLDITVTNHKTETFADYAIRTFILQKKGTQERRQVQQFHFLVWPDKGVPRHATAVLALRRKVRMSHNSNNKNPLVVHCSAGIGRTGAFIVIDAMLESIEKKKVVDVCNYIQLLRNNRISMIQTEEEYVFINMALLESITCGNTEIPAHDIRIALKKLLALNPKTKMSGLACEYQRLDLITADDVTDIEDDIGRRKKSASKNRFPDILPLNGSRVILKDANNDYINASYVDTFRERNSFIMTQAPLKNTIEDFWKMIWDYNIGTIVMLNEQKEGGQVYPMYWATEGSATFGEFTVETTSHEIFQDFSQREFSVAKKEDPQTVHQVHH